MNKQMSLSAFDDELAQVRTKKKEFLAKIDRIIPWGEWLALNTRYFGYKAHIGVDKGSGLVHTVVGTPANEHDVTQTEHLRQYRIIQVCGLRSKIFRQVVQIN